MKTGNLTFNHFKKYASFLFNDLLDEFVAEDYKRNLELDLPLLKFFRHLTEDQIRVLSRKSVTDYLNDIMEGTAVSSVLQNMQDWKEDKLPGISKDHIGAADIALLYNARKHTLYKFLPRYTLDLDEVLSIINEVENFYTFQETLAIQTYSEIHQEKLILSQERLKDAQALARMGHWQLDYETKKVEWSEELYKMFGIAPDSEITQEKIHQYVKQDILPTLLHNQEEAIRAQSSFTHEYKIKRPDGNTRTIFETGYADKNSAGKPILRGISMDITERKQIEEELRTLNSKLEERVKERTKELSESEERYKTFVRQISEGIWRFELEIDGISIHLPPEEVIQMFYRYAYLAECNDMMAKIYGFSRAEEMIGLRLDQMLPLSDPGNRAYVTAFVESGYRLIDGESLEFDKEGNPKYFLNNLVGIIKDEKLVRVWGSQRDITDKKKALTALQESEAQYRFLAETVPQIFWTGKPDGGIDYFNQKWYEYTGLSFEETKEWGWQVVLHPDDLENCLSKWKACVISGELYQVEYRFKRASDGMYRWHLGRALPLKDNHGNIVKWFGTSTDIHEQKTAIEELAKANKELVKINNDLDTFVYTASHDLKAPITNIEGLISSLLDALGDQCLNREDTRTIIGMISSSIGRFRNTIHELSEIGKIQKNIPEDISLVNVSELIENQKHLLEKQIRESAAIIETDISEYPIIKFSRKDLKSIIYNLLSNAIKFRAFDRTPRIKIKTYSYENFVVLSVADNGLGIPEDKIGKVFSMFRRYHDHVEGTGIGLYIVKRIVDNNHGYIEVESTEGKGTEFKIYFRN